MVNIRLERYSYRFAEQVLNAKLAIKQELEAILTSDAIELATLSRPNFNKVLRTSFVAHGWQDQPHVFSEEEDPAAKMDFLKERVGLEVGFGHASFIGIDLLKFQVSSYSGLDQIDHQAIRSPRECRCSRHDCDDRTNIHRPRRQRSRTPKRTALRGLPRF